MAPYEHLPKPIPKPIRSSMKTCHYRACALNQQATYAFVASLTDTEQSRATASTVLPRH
ncbi:protein of unknown function (plasmid) [Cupriavidus taiwanensis]|uniref:Uncharacterized protein n=1 Tax=Cupriavidus taiwanensis TaxID=164546 RepID=A0A375DT32_9BURK|nr:hypothetical protein CBM2597_P230001 [Cupriavidus taiwanensis]SOZ95586.1 hypothetical protein CBM2598_P210001 [Cupriavidus taiwanensis]SPC25231.1 hypothetical protein CBM2594_P210002 [Cupriavidus taiwanensis]SPD61757.1 protein of unknown function [Cupriavidus taiwanensis]SPD69577.1 protein of unknown function [Cupriavidus taiwanensis]